MQYLGTQITVRPTAIEVMKLKLFRRFVHGVIASSLASTGARITSVCTIALLSSAAFEVRAADSPALPVTTAQPQSQTFELGSTVSFSVTATSGTPLSYQWRFNGAALPQATNSVHAVASAQSQDVGYYVAVVQNSAGVVPSLPAFLSLEYTNGGTVNLANIGAGFNAPVIDVNGTRLSGPYSVELVAGPESNQMKPTGPVNVNFSNGYFIAGTRAISTVQAGETAYVQVRVWDNRGGTVTTFEQARATGTRWTVSNTISVMTGGGTKPPPHLVGLNFYLLGGPFRLSGQPTSQTVVAGSTVVLQAQVLPDTVPVRFQWRKDGGPIAGATNAILSLTQVSLIDAANYSLVVSIENQRDFMVSSNASLSVLIPDGGTVVFANIGVGLNSPFYGPCGFLNGTNWLIELLPGRDPGSLASVGLVFRPRFLNGYFNAGTVVIPNIAPGGNGLAAVRLWDGSLGAGTYEEAVQTGVFRGQSSTFFIDTGGAGEPPSAPRSMVGMPSISWLGGSWPTRLSVRGLTPDGQLLLRIDCGASNPWIDYSLNLVDWTQAGRLSGESDFFQFSVEYSPTGSARFYRVRQP